MLSIFSSRAAAQIERSDQEQTVASSERRFRDFAEASGDHFRETDDQHCFLRVSAGARSLLGMRPDKVVGSTRWQIPCARPLEDHDWSAHHAVVDAHREFREFLYSIESVDGEKFISVSGIPVFDDHGTFAGYRGTATDVYHPEMKERSDERMRVQALLSTMVENDRVENHYQLQVDDESRVMGVEAVARLGDDHGVLIEHAQFIGVAEDSGLIFTLGEQVLKRALLDMRKWRLDGVFNPQFVAVNVGPRQFLQDSFVDMVVSALKASGQNGESLELEITDSPTKVIFSIARCPPHGCRANAPSTASGTRQNKCVCMWFNALSRVWGQGRQRIQASVNSSTP